jgi:hypothetical protein
LQLLSEKIHVLFVVFAIHVLLLDVQESLERGVLGME